MSERKTPNAIDVIARDCLAARLRSLSRSVSRLYDEALREHGVRASQLNILVAVGKLGVARPVDVCTTLQLDPSTLSRNAERMRANGWLAIESGRDGRAQPLSLTRDGRKLLQQALPAWKAAQREVIGRLGRDGAAQVHRAADEMGFGRVSARDEDSDPA